MLKVVASTVNNNKKFGYPVASENDNTQRNTVITTF